MCWATVISAFRIPLTRPFIYENSVELIDVHKPYDSIVDYFYETKVDVQKKQSATKRVKEKISTLRENSLLLFSTSLEISGH